MKIQNKSCWFYLIIALGLIILSRYQFKLALATLCFLLGLKAGQLLYNYYVAHKEHTKIIQRVMEIIKNFLRQ